MKPWADFKDFSRLFVIERRENMLEVLADRDAWIRFYENKVEAGHLRRAEEKDLQRFIEAEEYAGAARRILAGEPMPYPSVKVISKKFTGKKRTVFLFPREENYALKLLASCLHKYDSIFAYNLYSFRQGTGVYRAIRRLLHRRRLGEYYVYKADIHDYFNSIDIDKLLLQLREIMADDPALLRFFEGMLRCPLAVVKGETVSMQKGVMAGTPTAPFLANVYLMEMDHAFARDGVLYARYSDDIIVFAKTKEELAAHVERIHGFLREKGLEINPAKEEYTEPGEMWTFLGFSFHNGLLDVAPSSVRKLKAKMRRKARVLIRWRVRNGLDGGKAARAFIRRFNRKLFETSDPDDLNWSRWYFPVINTDKSLHVIDEYMQDCIRYIVAGNHGKKRFNLRYETMKEWGYKPLVHAYYSGEYRPERIRERRQERENIGTDSKE